MNLEKIGRYISMIFIGLLPWSVVITVFGADKLGFDIFRYFKEIFLVIITALLLFTSSKRQLKFRLDIIDWSILSYVLTLILVSVFTGASLKAYMFGLRYDTGFLLAFMVLRRALPVWKLTFQKLAQIFLISGGILILVSLVIRYIVHEDYMTLLGFSPNASMWDGTGAPPMFHGIPGAGVIRFQGLLEGPNQMAFFLLTYIGAYCQLMWAKKKYFVMNISIIAILTMCLLMTYSRSSYIGFALAAVFVLCKNGFSKLQQTRTKQKKRFIRKYAVMVFLGLFLISVCGFLFSGSMSAIFARHASTSGHFERMYIGYLRFLEHPFGHGLAQAGPASRVIAPVNETPVAMEGLDARFTHVANVLHERNPEFVFSTATYYIPESWYIQQMIEGGFLALIFFCLTAILILIRLKNFTWLAASFVAIMTMNIFLHSFESVHSALACFLLLASVIPVTPHTSRYDT